jgi:heme exporter protein B
MSEAVPRRRRRALGPVVADIRAVPPARTASAHFLVRQTIALLRKDLVTEWRTRETAITLLFFALLLVIIFAFSLWVDETISAAVSPAVIWIALAFTGTLAIDRSFAQEQEGDTLTALVLVPGASRALFIAKTMMNIGYMLLVEMMVVPLVILILSAPMPADGIPALICGLVAGTVGFAAVGTVFSAMLVTVRRRGVLLPIILYPITIPLLIMGVESAQVLMQNFPLEQSWAWIKVMVAVDVLYLLGGGWLFGHITEDE